MTTTATAPSADNPSNRCPNCGQVNFSISSEGPATCLVCGTAFQLSVLPITSSNIKKAVRGILLSLEALEREKANLRAEVESLKNTVAKDRAALVLRLVAERDLWQKEALKAHGLQGNPEMEKFIQGVRQMSTDLAATLAAAKGDSSPQPAVCSRCGMFSVHSPKKDT